MNRLAILLDVDGVLTADVEQGRLLLCLAADLDAELVWATARGAQANLTIAEATGLPPLPHIDMAGANPVRRSGVHWKVPYVAAWAGDRPIVWFDDEFAGPDHTWAAMRAAPTLLVPVDDRMGLTAADVASVAERIDPA